MNTCNMCDNPYPYMCSECQQCWEEETEEPKICEASEKIFVGSGEDVVLYD